LPQSVQYRRGGLDQVRNKEFDQALHERLELAEQEKRNAIALAEAKATKPLEQEVAKMVAEIECLKGETKSSVELAQVKITGTLKEAAAKKDAEIQQIKADLKAADAAKQLALQ
jgi:hypothetical protein